eukprot:scaffold131428_cov20-Tisochrysis_lutea.AAC.3
MRACASVTALSAVALYQHAHSRLSSGLAGRKMDGSQTCSCASLLSHKILRQGGTALLERRGTLGVRTMQARLAELEQEQEALRVRKAQQLPPTIEHPAIPPKPEPKPLTVPHPFKLRSEARFWGPRSSATVAEQAQQVGPSKGKKPSVTAGKLAARDALLRVRHENYVAEFTSHLSEEERQKQAEAEFKCCTLKAFALDYDPAWPTHLAWLLCVLDQARVEAASMHAKK